MNNITFIKGRVAGIPKLFSNTTLTKCTFSVIPNGKNGPVHIEAAVSKKFAEHINIGDAVEIIGIPLTRKLYINDKEIALPYVLAQTITRNN